MLSWVKKLFGGGPPAQPNESRRAPDEPKSYRLAVASEDMRDLVPHRLGAIVSDRVGVEGRPVGYMWRSAPVNPADGGWAFLAGDEDEAFMDEPANHSVFAVNTIANHDPAIIPYLDAPVGSAFYREGNDFLPDPAGPPDERG